MDAKILLPPIEDISVQASLEIDNQQLSVSDANNLQLEVNAEEELMHCRNLNKELTSRIEAFELDREKSTPDQKT